jgi:hypothetical protein
MSLKTLLLYVHSSPCVRKGLFLIVASLGTKDKCKPKSDVTCHTIYLLKSAVLLRYIDLTRYQLVILQS